MFDAVINEKVNRICHELNDVDVDSLVAKFDEDDSNCYCLGTR